MWEQLIYFNTKNYSIMQSIANRLNVGKYKGVAYYVNNYVLHIKIEHDKQRMISCISSIIAYELALFYKQNYINNKIIVEGKFQHVLPKLLTMFELTEDANFVASKIDLSRPLYVESFYMFKCNILRSKWGNLVRLISTNQIYLSSSEVAIEFFSFLLDNISSKIDVDLCESNGKYLVKCGNNHTLYDNEEDVLISLMNYVPRKINVYCSKLLTNQMLKALYQLFSKKINLLA